jgi:hypothetical protein
MMLPASPTITVRVRLDDWTAVHDDEQTAVDAEHDRWSTFGEVVDQSAARDGRIVTVIKTRRAGALAIQGALARDLHRRIVEGTEAA